MFDENLISFCIPTYNRAEILGECLADLLSKIRKFNFEIIVSDNYSNDGTKELVKKYQDQYGRIKYIQQECKLNVDVNFANALSYSTSKYTWLLGDSYRLADEFFLEIIELCALGKYPLILANSFDMIQYTNSKTYSDLSTILKDLGWYLPFMSAYIYHEDILNNSNFQKYYNSNFLQMGIVFDYFENKEFEIYWFSRNAITSTALKKQSWHNEFLHVFAKNWTEFILSLPRTIELAIKLQCIKDHGRRHKLFSLRNLLNFRERGWLSYQIAKEYKIYFQYIAIYPWPIVAILSRLPRVPLSLLRRKLAKD